MKVIYRDGLTTAERKEIEERYDGYHHCEEFWVGFVDYQNGRDCPNGWSDSVAGQDLCRVQWMRIAASVPRSHVYCMIYQASDCRRKPSLLIRIGSAKDAGC